MAQYKIIPIKLKDANIFVAQNHRHNKPIDHRSHRFSLGLVNGEDLIGVAIAGLPIARKQDDGKTLEIMRVCVKEGNPNANSMLYGRVRRIAGLMGYERIITYTLQSESASSLKGVGAVKEAEINRPSKWGRPARPRIEQNVYKEKKVRWNLPPLNQPRGLLHQACNMKVAQIEAHAKAIVKLNKVLDKLDRLLSQRKLSEY